MPIIVSTPILDDATMAANSHYAAASQASVKAYIDARSFYGVTWNESTDGYARTGTLAAVAVGSSPGNSVLPIQAMMRRCVLNNTGGVAYYLNPTDSTLKVGGGSSVLTGTDGQVMVEIPAFWTRYSYAANTHHWDISPVLLPGFSLHPAFIKNGVAVPFRYVSAYEACIYDASASAYAGSFSPIGAHSATFASPANTITAGVGTPYALLQAGDVITISGTVSNNATFVIQSVTGGNVITTVGALTGEVAAATVISPSTVDTANDILASVSGKKPFTNITRANYRSIAAKRGTGWRQLDFYLLSAIQLLYLTEYASFYSQSMIGAGITNVGDWAAYNNCYPIANTGNSNAIGNATGNTAGAATASAEVSHYLSYRGIENWFGHLWKFVDGFNINNNVPYVSNVDTQFADDTLANYTAPGITMSASDGWQATLAQIANAFLPLTVGAGSTTKITDYYYQDTGWRVAFFGGHADPGAIAGGFALALNPGSGLAYQGIGGQLAY